MRQPAFGTCVFFNSRYSNTYMTFTFKRSALAIAGAGLLALYGCGGGGGDGVASTPPVVQTLMVSGTAAAGLPLVGTVTVKDSKGVTRSTPIAANGAYSIDVTDLTAPFLFRAAGTVGGRTYVIHSAASAADTNGTINITPLTDLIVANIAGQLAQTYFNGGNFSALTKSDLDAETASLKAKLLPVLTAMGVDSSIDLLRTAFTPLSSALDKALDVISVSVDPATNVATITNLVTQQQITDNLATKAAAETTATPLDGAGMATAADDITLIRKALSDFSAKFATGLPAPATLLPQLTSTDPVTGTYNFRFGDKSAASFTNQIAANGNVVGGSFTNVTIRKIDYVITASNTSPRAFVEFDIKNKDGIGLDHVKNMQLVKGTDGVWRLRGDGRVLDTYGNAHMVKDGLNNCVMTGLEFGFQDLNTSNSANVAYVMVSGPGLPVAGLKYQRSQTGDNWTIQNAGNQNGGRYYRMASNCNSGNGAAGVSDAAIAAIPDDSAYTMTGYTSADVVAQFSGFDIQYKERIQRRPMTLAEAAAATFPSVTTSSPLASYTGGAMTISATGTDPGRYVWFYLGLTDAAFATTSADDDAIPGATGAASASLTLTTVSPPLTHREIRVESHDIYWRNLMTVQNYLN